MQNVSKTSILAQFYCYILLQIHMKDKNSTVWELTTKFQKGGSEIDFINATIINDNDLQPCDRTEDLFLITNQVKVCKLSIIKIENYFLSKLSH